MVELPWFVGMYGAYLTYPVLLERGLKTAGEWSMPPLTYSDSGQAGKSSRKPETEGDEQGGNGQGQMPQAWFAGLYWMSLAFYCTAQHDRK